MADTASTEPGPSPPDGTSAEGTALKKRASQDPLGEQSPSSPAEPPQKKAQPDEFASDGEEEERRTRLKEVDNLTRLWAFDEPYINVEEPIPENSAIHFCWYDLSRGWANDGRPPGAPAVPLVNGRLDVGKKGFVDLPFADTYNAAHGTSKRPRNELILEALRSFSNGVRDLEHLQSGIRTYWKNYEARTLRKILDGAPQAFQVKVLKLLGDVAKLALKSKHIVTKGLPRLNFGEKLRSVSMSQEQAAMLLAYCFFCTFKSNTGFTFMNFHMGYEAIYEEKMNFLLCYFQQVVDNMPCGTLTFSRQVFVCSRDERAGYGEWKDPLCDLHVTAQGLIEEMECCLQVDFANAYIGGGVMNTGAVQEEIRFLCCPEMLVSILLCDYMRPNEAILIQGAQQYSGFRGYASGMKHMPLVRKEKEERDMHGRARSYLVAIDAIQFKVPHVQYKQEMICREMKKAYAGFMRLRPDSPRRPIATGNWGCGVFNGDKELKSLIQIIAASKAQRPMIYVTFGDHGFAKRLKVIHDHLKKENVTAGLLYSILMYFNRLQGLKESVFDFVVSALKNPNLMRQINKQ